MSTPENPPNQDPPPVILEAPKPANAAAPVFADTPAPTDSGVAVSNPVPTSPVTPNEAGPSLTPVSDAVSQLAPAQDATVYGYDPQTGEPVLTPPAIYGYDTATGAPITTKPETREIMAYDVITGKPIYAPNADEIDSENWVIESYDRKTGKPIYRKHLSVKGDHEYFVNNVGTVYGDSPGHVMKKLYDVRNITVPLTDIGLIGLNSHEDSSTSTEG